MAAEARSPLWSDHREAEWSHQLGKVHNLRLAGHALDGVIIPAHATFSFWRQVGRASRGRGFVNGRMLQQGCMVPAVGGGLCQLSNALYDAALLAGCEIVERHAHSRRVAGSATMAGRDATVAWNYVDLRFRAERPLQLSVQVTPDELVVRLLGVAGIGTAAPTDSSPRLAEVRSCATCAETACMRHEPPQAAARGRQAFLVDEAWPEFQTYVATEREAGSSIGIPLPPRLSRRSAWPAAGVGPVRTATLAGVWRSLAIRRADQGAARRRAEVEGAARIARRLAPLLTADVTRVWVAQSYLPHLWRAGHLGGRRFSVLMTRPPISVLQSRLDAAYAAHPERATLADYRADPSLAAAEGAALDAAEAIVTPHADIAALFGDRAIRLAWHKPAAPLPRPDRPGRRIAFPGPVLARKGAYEVREAARVLGLEVMLLGNDLEGAGFWGGVTVLRADPAHGPGAAWHGVAAIVQPAVVEEQPRQLLAGIAAGIPVLATAACGLDRGFIPIAPLDAADLIAALQALFSGAPPVNSEP